MICLLSLSRSLLQNLLLIVMSRARQQCATVMHKEQRSRYSPRGPATASLSFSASPLSAKLRLLDQSSCNVSADGTASADVPAEALLTAASGRVVHSRPSCLQRAVQLSPTLAVWSFTGIASDLHWGKPYSVPERQSHARIQKGTRVTSLM